MYRNSVFEFRLCFLVFFPEIPDSPTFCLRYCVCMQAKGFELSYLEKVPEVKDTVHKQSLLHHVCSTVVEKFPDSTDLYSEIGAITRLTKVYFLK